MALSEMELVELGSRFTTQRIIEQGGVSVAVARAHAQELAKKFPAAKVDELEMLLGEIRGKYEVQAGAKDARGIGNVPVGERVAEAKRWIREVMTSADNAYEEEPEKRDEFHRGGKIGVSVPKVTGRLQTLLTLAEAHKADLGGWGVADEDLARGRQILSDLAAANTSQERAMKNLPSATKELYLLKGKTFLLLKRLARAGRDVFKDDPPTAAKLNLDILRRRASRRDEAGPESAAATAPGT